MKPEFMVDASGFQNLTDEQKLLLRQLESVMVKLRAEAIRYACPKGIIDTDIKISLNVIQEDIIKRYW